MSRLENLFNKFYPAPEKRPFYSFVTGTFLAFTVAIGGGYLYSRDHKAISDELLKDITSNSKIIFSPSTGVLAYIQPDGNGGQTVQVLDSDGKINTVYVTLPGDELTNLQWSNSTIPTLLFEIEGPLEESAGMQVSTATISEHKILNTQTGKLETLSQNIIGERIDS